VLNPDREDDDDASKISTMPDGATDKVSLGPLFKSRADVQSIFKTVAAVSKHFRLLVAKNKCRISDSSQSLHQCLHPRIVELVWKLDFTVGFTP
jgi:hypothetical protein